MRNDKSQRGEGKIGCIITLLVLAIIGAAAIKVVPVYFANNEFLSAVENIAGRAAILPLPTIQAQIRGEAQRLGITEALAPEAIQITKTGDRMAGTCTVRVKYTRQIEFYGIFTYPFETDQVKAIPIVDAR